MGTLDERLPVYRGFSSQGELVAGGAGQPGYRAANPNSTSGTIIGDRSRATNNYGDEVPKAYEVN